MISFREQFGEDCVYKHGEPYMWFNVLSPIVMIEPHNPLAAMCNYRDQHSTSRLPVSTAKEAPAGIFAVSGFDHRPGAWKA